MSTSHRRSNKQQTNTPQQQQQQQQQEEQEEEQKDQELCLCQQDSFLDQHRALEVENLQKPDRAQKPHTRESPETTPGGPNKSFENPDQKKKIASND